MKKRKVICYLLWATGKWDTGVLSIPNDTPKDQLDAAVRLAASKTKWAGGVEPVAVCHAMAGTKKNLRLRDGELKDKIRAAYDVIET